MTWHNGYQVFDHNTHLQTVELVRRSDGKSMGIFLRSEVEDAQYDIGDFVPHYHPRSGKVLMRPPAVATGID